MRVAEPITTVISLRVLGSSRRRDCCNGLFFFYCGPSGNRTVIQNWVVLNLPTANSPKIQKHSAGLCLYDNNSRSSMLNIWSRKRRNRLVSLGRSVGRSLWRCYGRCRGRLSKKKAPLGAQSSYTDIVSSLVIWSP